MRKSPRSWRTVRVFISSTFRDMHAERDHLVKVTFPALREQLQVHRVHLVDIDLRWGVTQHQADNDRATDLCLRQVDTCRPFFLGILGQRYGYVPKSPAGPAVSEYRELLSISGKSVTELEIVAAMHGESSPHVQAIFFVRDPAFIADVPLAKRVEVEAESPEAGKNLARLKEAIGRRLSSESGIERYSCSYRGLRVNPRLVRELGANARQEFASIARDGVVDPAEYEGLAGPLLEFIHRHGVVYTGDLDDFGRRAQQRLWDVIQRELDLPHAPPPEAARDRVAEEEESHDRFMESRLRFYVERKRVQRQLLQNLEGEDPSPLLVTGPPGSGKSALMAWLAETLEQRPGAIRIVVPHFIGASPASTSVRRLLRRLCCSLRKELASAGETAERQPERVDELVRELRTLAEQIPQEDRFVLIIDALDQMDGTDNAHAMHWLPGNLPANLRVIVSCIAKREGANETEPLPTATTASRVLAAFRHRPHRRIDVPPLSDEELLEIIRDVPSISAKTLDREQRSLLVSNPATRNPLFLLVALEELRGFGSFDQLDARIARFPRDGDTLTAIFLQVMERLEEEFGRGLVRRALSCLACSRFGLSERELQELAIHVEPLVEASGLMATGLYDLLRQIRSYTQHRAELLDFFHGNFRSAVHRRYLDAAKDWREVNATLAGYFRGKADPDADGSWTGGYSRGLSELPHHLEQAAEGEALQRVLTDFRFLQAKIVEFGPGALIEDFDLACEGEMITSPEEADTLRLVRDALRLSADYLASDPSQLLGQLWGRLVNEKHPPTGPLLDSFAAAADRPWLRLWTFSLTRPRPVLWQTDLTASGSDLGQPRVGLTSDAKRIMVASADGRVSVFTAHSPIPMIELEGHAEGGAVLDVVVTDEGGKVRTLRQDGSVDTWDLVDQAFESRQRCAELPSLVGTAHALASDGNLLMIGTESGSIELRRLDEPDFSQRLEGHDARVIALAAAPAVGRVVAAYVDGEMRTWDLEQGLLAPPDDLSGKKIGSERWRDHNESPPEALALAGSGETLFAGSALMDCSTIGSPFATRSNRGMLSEWDLGTGTRTTFVEAYPEEPVRDLDVTADGRFGVTLSIRDKLKMWDLTTVENASRLDQHSDSAPVVAITPDGRRVLSAADDGMFVVWDLTTGEVERWRGYREPALDLCVSTDSRYAIVVSSGHCNVWDLEEVSRRTLGDPTALDDSGIPPVWVRTVDPLGPEDRALTVGSDGTITTWNLSTGEPESTPTRIPDNVLAAAVAGRWLLYAPDSNAVVLWDLKRMATVGRHRFENTASGTKLFSISDDGRFFIQRGSNAFIRRGEAFIWSPDQAAPEALAEAGTWGTAVAMQAGGEYALFLRGQRTLSLRNWLTGSQVAAFTVEEGLSYFALGADGGVVAASDCARRVHILFLEMPE